MPGGATSGTATLISSLPYSDSSTSAMTVSAAAANASADAVAALLNGGTIRIYTAPQPSSADVATTTQILLASPTFGSPAFAASVAGVATANAITAATAAASGTANWARFVTSGGATVYDGLVGTTSAPTFAVRLSSLTITSGHSIAVTSATYRSPVVDRGRWYQYTSPTPAVPNAIGVFAYSGSNSSLGVHVFSPDAVTSAIASSTTPVQCAVAAGVTSYLKLSGGSACDYTLSVLAGPTTSAPVGSLFVPDDTATFPAVFLSSTDGTVLRLASPFPAGESGDVIAAGSAIGRFLVYDTSNGHLVLYNPDLTVRADLAYRSLADLSDHTFSIRTNRAISNFYVSDPKDTGHSNKQTVTTVTSAGAFGPTTWVLTNQGVLRDGGMAPSLDETILYVVNSASSSVAAVNRWDLINNVALTDLVAGIANYSTYEMLVLADGTILVMYQHNTSTNAPMVKHYDATGATLNTYTFTGSQSFDTRLAYALDDPVSFWAWTKLDPSTGQSRFTNVRVSDGAILTTFDVMDFEKGIYQGVRTATPLARFGPSESCPFLILRPPLITGTIELDVPPPNSSNLPSGHAALALTGYPLPPRHLEALCRTIMTIAALSPDARQRVFNSLGVVLSGAKLQSYEAGTSTPLATYSDSALTVPNTNPVIADSGGLFGPVYLLAQSYKFELYDSNDLLVWSQDNVWDVGELLEATITGLQTQVTANLAKTQTQFCTTQFNAVTSTTGATLTNIVGLTGFTLAAAGVYAFDIYLAGTSTANCGLKVGFGLTTATLTNLEATGIGYTASAVSVQHTTTATTGMMLFGQTAAVISARITGRLTVNAAGTLAVQAAQNAAHADTTSIYIGSWASFVKVS